MLLGPVRRKKGDIKKKYFNVKRPYFLLQILTAYPNDRPVCPCALLVTKTS